MAKDYVANVEGAYRVAGSRVSLDSIVYAFLRGESPDGIAESFPALTLEQVSGAIAFYLAHRDEIDPICVLAKPTSSAFENRFAGPIRLCTPRLRPPVGAQSPHADEATLSS